MQSLRDKLLKAGLVTEDQALKAESKIVVKRAPPPSPSELEGKRRSEGGRGRPSGDRGRAGEGRGRPPGGRRERSPSANIPKLPPMPGSRAYQQAESRRQLEQAKAQRELVLAHQVEIDVGATVFYFMTRKKLLRRLELTEAQAAELEAGRLAVVERPDPDRIEHALVPAAAADALLEKFPKAVRFYNRADQPIGFMSDDEIQRRSEQQAEKEAAAAAQEADAGAEGPGPQQDADAAQGTPEPELPEGGDVPEKPDPDAGGSAPAPEPAPSEGGDVPEKPGPDTTDSA
ncbi:MAG TPA: DUF2058 family protein [Myxococcaceae bacterium]|nr:DUF2058 family protein [Myxococcaceae bacterium]